MMVKRNRQSVDFEDLSIKRVHIDASDTVSDELSQQCDHCCNINFSKRFRQSQLYEHEGWIGQPVPFALSPTCTICSTLRSMVPDIKIDPARPGDNCARYLYKYFQKWQQQDSTYLLKSFSANAYFGIKTKGESDGILIGILPSWIKDAESTATSKARLLLKTVVREGQRRSGFLTLLDNSITPGPYTGRKLSTVTVDWNAMRGWMRYCDKHHTRSCRTVLDHIIFQLPIKVINCRTRQIVTLPADSQYSALSYVWGPVDSDVHQQQLDMVPKVCPAVIEDAMQATLRLGYDHCWIDRYCIDQSNADSKHDQLANMDSIYACASITIVAASSKGSNDGLPGVGSTPRPSQPTFTSGTDTIGSSLPDPSLQIQSSKWSSRGWTYQEGLLSRRRLIFTEHQVSFQCSAMHCFESINLPLEALHTKAQDGRKRFHEKMQYGRSFPLVSIARRPTDFVDRVNEYANRSLSYDEDGLNAFLGVLKMFLKAQQPVLHIFGMPIFPHNCFDYKKGVPNWIKSFAFGLTWRARSGTRRPGLPSWSWVGWKNWDKFEIGIQPTAILRDRLNDDKIRLVVDSQHADLEIGLANRNGTISWVTEKDFEMPVEPLLPQVFVTAYTTSMHLLKQNTSYGPVYKWLGCDCNFDKSALFWNGSMLKDELHLKAVLMLQNSRRSDKEKVILEFLLLEPCGGAYERIGTAVASLPVRERDPNSLKMIKLPDKTATIGRIQLAREQLCLV